MLFDDLCGAGEGAGVVGSDTQLLRAGCRLLWVRVACRRRHRRRVRIQTRRAQRSRIFTHWNDIMMDGQRGRSTLCNDVDDE